MNEAEFNQIVDELMFGVEETIDDSGVDIDYETVAETMLMVSASGTAVLLKPANSIKNPLNKKR